MLTEDMLTLRPFSRDDRDLLLKLADNPNVSRYLAPHFPSPYRLEDADNWISLTESEAQPLNLAIEWKGQLVGGIGAEPLSGLFARTAEMGYWLGEPYWGQGLAARAVGLFTPYVFNQLPLIRLQATVFADNYQSMRVLEKCGFNRECVLRSYISKNGVTTDAVLYAKVVCDFLSKAPKGSK